MIGMVFGALLSCDAMSIARRPKSRKGAALAAITVDDLKSYLPIGCARYELVAAPCC